MNKADINCFRINYNKTYWIKHSARYGAFLVLPSGILNAVEALCAEVERLQRVIARRKK